VKTYTHDEVLKLLRAQAAADATRVEDADDGVPLGCLADAIRAASLVLDAEPEVTESDEHGLRLRCRDLRARVAELEDDFAKRQASHCCPTWNDQMEDCDCDERMGGHIARWQEAEAEVARLRAALATREADVAARQREACAMAVLTEFERDLDVAADDAVRATPLVTGDAPEVES